MRSDSTTIDGTDESPPGILWPVVVIAIQMDAEGESGESAEKSAKDMWGAEAWGINPRKSSLA